MRRDTRRRGQPCDDALTLGMEVAYSTTGQWRQYPDRVRQARVVDMGPFAVGSVRGDLEVDGEVIPNTWYARASAGQYVAIRVVSDKPSRVLLVTTSRLVMPWANWGKSQAELDAARDEALRLQREAHEAEMTRRRAVAAELASAGVTVSAWADFGEDGRVHLTAAQVTKLTHQMPPVRRG